MKKKRLLDLADALFREARKKKPGVKFDLDYWISPKTTVWSKLNDDAKNEGQRNIVLDMSCAYAACAVGTACLLPHFQKQGLNFMLMADSNFMLPNFGKHYGMEAITEFFGITTSQAEILFLPDTYKHQTGKRAAREVACRIVKFAETGKLPEFPRDDEVTMDDLTW